MAKDKGNELEDSEVAAANAAEVAAIDKAANAEQLPSEPAEGETEAAEAELARQKDVVDAVAEAHETELPQLGGPLLEPGLGQ
jgi:hypothetical protein